MSHSAEKCKRGDPLDFINIYPVAKYQKTEKSRTMPKKIERRDPLVSSGFVSYVIKVKNERGDPFALISADWTRPYGSSYSSFDCKKSGPIRVRL